MTFPWVELIPNKSEKSMKNIMKKKKILDNIFERILSTKFLAKTFVVMGQTQSQNQP